MTDDSSLMIETTATHHGVMAPLAAVSMRQGLPSLAERLSEVQAWLSSDLSELDSAITEIEQCAQSPNLAERAARHLLRRKGKRLRPLCTHLGARLVGLTRDSRVSDLAVAAELVHAATLLHDDVIDEGTERRGAPASRIVYGNSASILGGDFLLIQAIERVQRTGVGAPLTKLLATIAQMVSAEALQLEQRGRFVPDRDIYYTIIEGKTASLFRWALSAAPLLAAHPSADTMARMGLELGLAFQLVDDALDLEGDPAEIGKDLFADLLQGKLTFPLIAACEVAPTLAREIRDIARDAGAGQIDPDRATALVKRVRETGAIARTRDIAEEHKRRALEALSELPRTRAAEALALVVDAAVERKR
jgi:octaprenyl-diphosphate synthase